MRLARQAGRLHAQNYFFGFVAEILEADKTKVIRSKDSFGFDGTPRLYATNKKLEHSTKRKCRREYSCRGHFRLFEQCCQHK